MQPSTTLCVSCSLFVLQFATFASNESMFRLSMFNGTVSGIMSSTWPFPRTTKNTQCFFEFLNWIVTTHVSTCVIYVLLYIFNFMLLFMEPLAVPLAYF